MWPQNVLKCSQSKQISSKNRVIYSGLKQLFLDSGVVMVHPLQLQARVHDLDDPVQRPGRVPRPQVASTCPQQQPEVSRFHLKTVIYSGVKQLFLHSGVVLKHPLLLQARVHDQEGPVQRPGRVPRPHVASTCPQQQPEVCRFHLKTE